VHLVALPKCLGFGTVWHYRFDPHDTRVFPRDDSP
jgi:hypothetical protein